MLLSPSCHIYLYVKIIFNDLNKCSTLSASLSDLWRTIHLQQVSDVELSAQFVLQSSRRQTQRPSCFCQFERPAALVCFTPSVKSVCQSHSHRQSIMSGSLSLFSTRGSPSPQLTYPFLFYSIYFHKPQDFPQHYTILHHLTANSTIIFRLSSP